MRRKPVVVTPRGMKKTPIRDLERQEGEELQRTFSKKKTTKDRGRNGSNNLPFPDEGMETEYVEPLAKERNSREVGTMFEDDI